MDGIKFLNVLREKYKMLVIFLTAKSEDADIILGLENGLSIAKNLIQLQNGKMDIVIDGDLFKVIIKMKTA